MPSKNDDQNADAPAVRRINLMYLSDFATNLARGLRAALADETPAEVAARCVSAKCIACDETLAGGQLAAFLLPDDTEGTGSPGSMAFIRLRQGYCARLSCTSRYYEFRLQPHPAIDWTTISAGPAAESTDHLSTPQLVARVAWQSLLRQFTVRAGAVLMLLLALWMFRQWYTGGGIPVLRPARTFTSEFASPTEPGMEPGETPAER